MKILAVLLLFTGMVVSQEKYNLDVKFKQGDKFSIDYQTEQIITQTLGANAIKTDQSHRTLYEYEVTEIDSEGNAILKYTYKETGIKIKSANAMMNVTYDSKKDGTENVPPAAIGMAVLVGKSFVVTISKDNKVTKVEGMDKIIGQMLEKVGNNQPEMVKKQLEDQFKKSFGNESMKTIIQMMFDNTPGKEVAIGEKWKTNMNLKTMFTMKLENDYSLTKVENGLAFIAVKSNITTVKDGNNMEVNGTKIIPDLTGSQEGETEFDLTVGQLTKSKVLQDMKGSISVGAMNIPMTIKTKVTISAKKL